MLRKAYVSIKLMGAYTNRICPASIICLTVSAKCLSSFPKRLPNRNHMKPPVQREKAMEGPLLLRKKCLSTKSSFNHHFAGSIMEDRVVIINKISQKWISSYPCPGYQDTFYSLWYWYSIVWLDSWYQYWQHMLNKCTHLLDVIKYWSYHLVLGFVISLLAVLWLDRQMGWRTP